MAMHELSDAERISSTLAGEHATVVLLVDDQAIIGEAVRRALMGGQPAIEYHYCADPGQAVSSAEKVKPTVILLDLVMPGVDGLTLVRQYRANAVTKNLPIIVLSTQEEPTVKSAAFAAGANDYLVKLPDKIELEARVRYHSRAYLNHIQRDEAYRALRASQQQLTAANIELERLCKVDGLTGLSNKRYFNEYIGLEWMRAIREQRELSVLMIDIDNFKLYNDTYGHLAGDDVLKRVGETIQHSGARAADLASRFGGEEFIILLGGTSLEGARHIAGMCRQSVEDLHIPHSASTTSAHVTITIGGATTVPQRGDTAFHQLIETADQALYEAKNTGKNRVVLREHQSIAK